MVHSGSRLVLGCLAGSILHMMDLLAVGNSHQMVNLSCIWIPDVQVQHGKLAVLVAAFSAGCVDVVEAVTQIVAASCLCIAYVRPLPAVMWRGLSPAVLEVLSLAVVEVDVVPAAAAAVVVVVVVA